MNCRLNYVAKVSSSIVFFLSSCEVPFLRCVGTIYCTSYFHEYVECGRYNSRNTELPSTMITIMFLVLSMAFWHAHCLLYYARPSSCHSWEFSHNHVQESSQLVTYSLNRKKPYLRMGPSNEYGEVTLYMNMMYSFTGCDFVVAYNLQVIVILVISISPQAFSYWSILAAMVNIVTRRIWLHSQYADLNRTPSRGTISSSFELCNKYTCTNFGFVNWQRLTRPHLDFTHE